MVYLNNIIIYSKGSLEKHIRHVEKVFELLNQAILQIKIKKYKFFETKIKFLNYEISEKGIYMDPEKVEAMQTLLAPKVHKS